MRVSFIIVLFAVLAAPAQAQLQLDAGASTLYGGGAGGAGVTAYLPDRTLYLGLGYANGRVLPGGYERFEFHGYDVTAGSQSIGYSLDGASVGLACVCVSTGRKWNRLTAAGFAGAEGQGFFFPWTSGAMPSHFGVGVLLQYAVNPRLSLSSLDVVTGGTKTLAQGASYRYRDRVAASGSAGLLNNQPFVIGRAGLRWDGFNFYASHNTYFQPYHATGNSVGGSYRYRFASVFGSLYSSKSRVDTHGESVTGALTFSRVSGQASWYHSSNEKMQTYVLSENITQRLMVTENVVRSNGRTSLQFGGSYQGNRAQVSVTHGVQFLLSGAGFQSVTSIQVLFRIHDTLITAQTLTDSFGKVHWTGQTESFIQTNLPSSGGRTTQVSVGKYQVVGDCINDTKKGEIPLEGCAIRIGNGRHQTIVYSNSHGKFELSVKKSKAVEVTVVLDEFTAQGDYEIVEAPQTATPDQPVKITVRRVP